MRVLVYASLALFANLALACDIYSEPGHEYKGEMGTTGSGYVAIFAGADDGTPYAGSLKGNDVYLYESNSVKIGTISGNQYVDSSGKTLATYANLSVKDMSGNLIGTADNRYNDCDAGVVLAGVEIFQRAVRPTPSRF